MSPSIDAEIQDNNQKALELEYTSALFIRDQIEVVIKLLLQQSDHKKQTPQDILDRCDQIIKAMIYAENRDTFRLHQERLRALVDKLTTQANFVLEGELERVVQQLRFYNDIHTLLHNATRDDFQRRYSYLPDRCKQAPEFPVWEEPLNQLGEPKTVREFNAEKKRLQGVLDREFAAVLDQKIPQSIVLIEDNMRQFAQYRMVYLKNTKDRSNLLAQTGWISIDFAMLITATVLVFASGLGGAAIAIAVMSLAIVLLGYNLIDFTQTAAELYSQHRSQKLYSRELTDASKAKLRQKLQTKLDINIDKLFNLHLETDEAWSTEKKWMVRLGYAACVVGLFLSVGGFIALMLPSLAIPMAVIIVGTAISFIVPIITTAILSRKILKERDIIKQTTTDTAEKIAEENAMMDEAFRPQTAAKQIDKVDQCSSTDAYLMKQGIMSKSHEPDSDDEESMSASTLTKTNNLSPEELDPLLAPHSSDK